MKTYRFEFTRVVDVTIDEQKLAPLMADFNAHISDFGEGDDALLRHAKHIARLRAEEVSYFDATDFVEGYGRIFEAGITAKIDDRESHCERVFPQAVAS